MDKLAVYLHWPFCLAKCPYCDFVSYPCANVDISEYEEKLLNDLVSSKQYWQDKIITSVFFGGGTPSLISSKTIEKIIDTLSVNFTNDVEITMEANPATFDEVKLNEFRTAGINRLSLGAQSFKDKNLNFLGRIYSEQQAQTAATQVAKIFDNFSFDFMYGYQDLTDLIDDLQFAVNLGAKHISNYQLTLEPGTPFYAKFMRDKTNFDDIDYMSHIEDFLKTYDINRYEISNFSKQGFYSKHNLTYWNYGDYLGCGASAHGRLVIEGQKHATTKYSNLKQWSDNIGKFEMNKILSNEEVLEEMIIVGLRKIEGIKFSELYRYFSNENLEKFITKAKIKFLQENGLIFQKNDKIQLTTDGLLKLNAVISFLMG